MKIQVKPRKVRVEIPDPKYKVDDIVMFVSETDFGIGKIKSIKFLTEYIENIEDEDEYIKPDKWHYEIGDGGSNVPEKNIIKKLK